MRSGRQITANAVPIVEEAPIRGPAALRVGTRIGTKSVESTAIWRLSAGALPPRDGASGARTPQPRHCLRIGLVLSPAAAKLSAARRAPGHRKPRRTPRLPGRKSRLAATVSTTNSHQKLVDEIVGHRYYCFRLNRVWNGRPLALTPETTCAKADALHLTLCMPLYVA